MRNKNLGVHTILIASALAMVAPFVWQIITSLKSLSNATRSRRRCSRKAAGTTTARSSTSSRSVISSSTPC